MCGSIIHYFILFSLLIGFISAGGGLELLTCDTEGKTAPFYRYWKGSVSDHFYTANAAEIGTTTSGKEGKHGYISEGVVGRFASDDATGPDVVNLYRYWKSSASDHFYTTNAEEIGTTTAGKVGKYEYKSEGVAGKCFKDKNARGNLVPLYRYFGATAQDHFYTANPNEIGTTTAGEVGNHGYKSEGVACYMFPATNNDLTSLLTGDGSTYRGCLSQTLSGLQCQQWSSQEPHSHSIEASKYPEKGIGDHNYCRNPDGHESIWCYTTDPKKRWEQCICHADETVSGRRGNGYRGCQSYTVSGRRCQKWSSQSPHRHSRTPRKFGKLGIGDHNHCRNPDGEPGGIWCYTTDRKKRWEYCKPIQPVALPPVNRETVEQYQTESKPVLFWDFAAQPRGSKRIPESITGKAAYAMRLFGRAKIREEGLSCNRGFARTVGNIPSSVFGGDGARPHSLEAAFKLTTLNQWGTSPIALDSAYTSRGRYKHDQFDAIVFNENGRRPRGDKMYIAGSEHHRRSKKPMTGGGAVAETAVNKYVHVVITYDPATKQVTMYRNGERYGDSYAPRGGFMTFDAYTRALVCRRHHRTQSLVGVVTDAAVYNGALSAASVLSHYRHFTVARKTEQEKKERKNREREEREKREREEAEKREREEREKKEREERERVEKENREREERERVERENREREEREKREREEKEKQERERVERENREREEREREEKEKQERERVEREKREKREREEKEKREREEREKQERERRERIRSEEEGRTKEHRTYMKRQKEETHKHLKSMKQEILEAMKSSFGKNNEQTVLLQKINDLKHQQTALELQHTLLEARRQSHKELKSRTDEIIQEQNAWERQRQKETQKRMKERQKLLRKENEMRMRDHNQLMNGLKGFLMTFSHLYQGQGAMDHEDNGKEEEDMDDDDESSVSREGNTIT